MSQTVTTPRQHGWWARRRLDRLRVAEETALTQARIQEAAARSDAAVQDVQRRTDGKQRAEDDSHRVADQQQARAAELRERAARLAAVAGVVAGFSLLVTAAGQVMFYTSMPWSGVYRVIAFVLFMGIEGPAWYFAYNARDLADQEKDYAWSARRVWVFALAAAAMNSYHGAELFGRWDMGIILGAPSLIGPYVWHKHVHRLEILALGRSREAVRAALRRRVRNPILSSRAATMWAQTGGKISRERAFLMVFFERHQRFPGELSEAAVKLLEERAAQRAMPAAGTAQAVADEATAPSAVSAARDALSAAGETLVDPLVSAPVVAETEVDRYLKTLAVSADSPPDPALNGHAANGHTRSLQVVPAADDSAATAAGTVPARAADGDRPRRAVQRMPNGARQRRRATRAAPGDYRSRIEDYVASQRTKGKALDDITGPDVERAVGCGESTARNTLAAIKKAAMAPS